MLSTRRLLRASKLLCDLKIIEGTNKCRFHVYSVNGVLRHRYEAVRRKQTPLAFGVINFASTDAASSSNSQVLPYSDADLKVLTELGIITPETEKPALSDLEGPLSPIVNETSGSDATSPEPSVLSSEEARSHPEEGLSYDSAPAEVLQEPQFFESSIIPEVRASPLDGSFEATVASTPEAAPSVVAAEIIPDVIPTVPNDAASIAGQVKDLIPPDVAATVAENVGKFAGEPAFSSIGLGGWGPVGLVQYTLEFFHVSLGLPWWGSIALGTLILRTLVFPLVIMSQRNAAKMNNNLPEMQAIQLKMSDARQRGDKLDAARYAHEMMEFMRVKGLNPMKNMIVPLAQAPFFISMFMGIRGMANLPVESFRHGGLWWFTDLTIADQFYALPLITSATLALTVEVGTDMGKLNSSNMGMAKYLLRAMPILIFPFTVNFPAGVLVYWCSTNFISLAQVAILKIPAVRDFFKIPRLIKHDKKALPAKDKGFVGGMKESWTNMKITRELEERERLDNSNFLRAGRGAIKKTYKFDPTQPREPRNLSSIQLKKRD